MVHKKRTVAPRSKPSAAPAEILPVSDDAAIELLQSDQNLVLAASSPAQKKLSSRKEASAIVEAEKNAFSMASIKLECERALTSLRRGNHTKALRLMKELSSKHDNSPYAALIHRVQGTVSVKLASVIDDPSAKHRHLKNAIESARKAVSLSPNSIEFAHFYATLLYEAANEAKEYEEVVQECERALSIENPIDPAKESLQEEQKVDTSPERIHNVRIELQSLIQKANLASISNWMKHINGEERFRLIPVRRASEDPMELRLVQGRRPNEIKKATKTPEERRKEIEVRVAAARLLQQKSETIQSPDDGVKSALDQTAGSGQRISEKRKGGNARKNTSSTERRDLVQSYWNSMTLDRKTELLRITTSDLKVHFSASKDGSANEVLSEALSFAETNKDWKFWTCCRCGEKFANAELHNQHVVQEHVGTLLPKLQSVFPQNVENEWAEMLLNCPWKPLDVSASAKMLDEQSRSKGLGSLNETEGSQDSFSDIFCDEDERDSSLRKKKLGDRPDGNMVDSREAGMNAAIDLMDCDDGSKNCFVPDKWPVSDDPDRANLLERIHAVFQALIENKYLASSHLCKVMHFAVEELRGLATGSQLYNYSVDQSPLCICFLGAQELKEVLKYLQELSHCCGLGRYSEKPSAVDGSANASQVFDNLEKLVFSEDGSCLVFDEHFLQCKLSRSSSRDTVSTDRTYSLPSNQYQNGDELDPDALLSWMFTGPSSVDQLVSWTRAQEEKAQQGMEILCLLEKEFYDLQGLCERKCEHLSYEEGLQAVEDLCLEEGKKREHATEFVRRSYDSVLRKRREELIERDNEGTFVGNRFEVDAILNVLKEAESLNVSRFGFEETYSSGTSQLRDLKSGEEDDWRLKDYLHQVDSCVEIALQRQKEHVSVELSKIDARIMRAVAGMQQLKVRLELASSQDYRRILVNLLKSFMRAHLENLAEKDATEKSDAAREAFLAELARDSKKSSIGGNDSSKLAHEKLKDKKRNKEYRKTKDSKPSTGNGPHLLDRQDPLSDVSFATHDGEDQGDETVGNGNSWSEQEEYRQRIELEAEERKLEETLAYQRRMENEAKLKHLSEQSKNTAKAVPGSRDAVVKSETYLKYSDNGLEINGQCKSSMEEPVMQKNGFPNSIEKFSRNSAEGMVQRTGLPNEGILEDSTMASARRSGRRGRRQKDYKLIDGKFQSASDERGNSEVGELRALDSSHADSGTKTLRQLHVEEDDEERFQADLKKAVRQSLDTLQAHEKLPLLPASRNGQVVLPEAATLGDGNITGDVNVMDVYGTGLMNDVGEYNCFLNVIIQSLWHLRRFRDEFVKSSSKHVHVGDPCVICALYEIFTALSTASAETCGKAVAPTSLRIALSNLYPDSNFFQEGQMNDASEVLGVIFDCLHRSFTSASGVSDTESADSSCMGTWDCSNATCIVHSLFGMDTFERMNCYNCGLESRHLKYTSFFHNINASALRTMKVMCPESSFDELLNLVEMNHQLACDSEVGGCGKLNYIHHILSTPPHVFTTVVGWQYTRESVDDITTTLSALSTEVDIGVLYRGLDPKNKHSLISLVCYYGQHYHCFAYSRDHGKWIMYDDKTVKVIGCWDDVLVMCERGHLQPQVLFFEAVN